MHAIVASLTSSDPLRVAEGVVQAGDFLATGQTLDTDHLTVREALIALADTDPPHPSAGAAVWALGKLGDPDLKPFFVQFLSRAVNRLDAAGHDVWQGIVALADCGEESLRVSGASRNFDENFRLASQFLSRDGPP